MIEKITIGLTYFSVAIVGLAMLPYLLYRGWVHTTPLKRKARGLDFDYRG